jgi:hypothetical protein
VTTPELDEALGLLDLPFEDRSFLTVQQGEGCVWRNDRDGETVEGLSLQISPGDPDDLAAGATLADRVGAPVEGVGDAAVWFAGPGSGTLSVAKASDLGYIFARITLERAGIGDAERLEAASRVAASALSRLPGVGRQLTTSVLEREAPDTSDQGLVGNLLGREEAGEWTRGEGLVATLELLNGEAEPGQVLRHPDRERVAAEATGIFEMAQHYLITGSDQGAQERIRNLLGRLVFSNKQLEAMAGIGAPSASPSATSTSATSEIVLAGAQSRLNVRQVLDQGALDCTQFFYDFEESPGVGQCLEWEPVNVGPEIGEDMYRIFIPAPSMPQAGWTTGHYANARSALRHAGPILEGLGGMPQVNVVFSVSKAGNALMAASNQGGGKPCGVFIFTSSQGISVPQFQQSLAHELGHCFTAHTLAPQSRMAYEVKKWWEEGVAEYLSNVAYDSVNFEWRWSEWLAGVELGTSVVARDYDNFAFFQHMANESSTRGVLTLLATLPACGSQGTDLTAEGWATCHARTLDEQSGALAGYEQIRDRYHEFAERMSDGSVNDTGGRRIPYRPPAIPITDPARYELPLRAFEVVRLHLQVPDGQYACLDHDQAGGTVTSWRAGKPDGLGPERDWERQLPLTLRGEGVFAATAITDGALYTLEVKDFVDRQSDCVEDDGSSGGGSPCELLLCGPSDFYRSPEQLESWLLDMLPPIARPS